MNQAYEVPEPILNSPFDEPARHWFIREGEQPELRPGRRPAIVYPPREERANRQESWTLTDGTLKPSADYAPGLELLLVNVIRQRLAEWRNQDYPGVTRTTHELLHHWRRQDRQHRLFFAQIEAAETIIFLTEARADLRQGVAVPRDEPSDDKKADGYAGFLRYACKMATGSGFSVASSLARWFHFRRPISSFLISEPLSLALRFLFLLKGKPMTSNLDDYKPLHSKISKAGFFTTIRPGPRGCFYLICVSSKNVAGEFCGNSFWVWLSHSTSYWYEWHCR